MIVWVLIFLIVVAVCCTGRFLDIGLLIYFFLLVPVGTVRLCVFCFVFQLLLTLA